MRKKFNLDKPRLDGFSVLVHGINAVGKTHLAGDFLREESKAGPVRFIDMAGEGGAMAAASAKLGEVGEWIDTYDSLLEALAEYKKEKVHAVVIDSLVWLNSAARTKIFKTNRAPSNPDEWTELHRLMGNIIAEARESVKYLLCTCPSDRSTDQVTQKTYVTPDLPGKEARSSAGWFDFVGYLTADVIAPGTVKRVFTLAPNSLITVKQRLPDAITDDITLPNGPGGWAVIKGRIEAAMNKLNVDSTKPKGV